MHRTERDESGVVGVILTLVIVWALVAVVMLTRTLQAAQQIDTRVVDITASVKGINGHLNTGCDPAQPSSCNNQALPVLSQTETIAAQINDAAKPLTGQVGQVLSDVNNVNTTASSILATATSINGTVHSINGLALNIGSSVHSIAGSINGINGDVAAIKGSGGLDFGVIGINNRASLIIGLVNGIKGDTATITNQAGQILGQAQAICHDQPVKVAGGLLPVTGPIC